MITENLSTLKIHKLSQEQYDRELQAGRIDTNALYLTPDGEFVKVDVQELTEDQKTQVRKNIGVVNTVTVKPNIAGFIRLNGTISTSTNYLRTDYLSLIDYKSIKYNSWVMSSTGMATWALFDADKKWLISSDDVNGDDYYNTSKTGSVLQFGYKKNTLSVSELLNQYPTAVYIVLSTYVPANYQSYIGVNGIDVGWGSSNPYIRLLAEETDSLAYMDEAVLYDRTQVLTEEQQLQARNNIGITSIGSNYNSCKYVEEFKNELNDWDAAFANLISYCTENGCVACATGTYELTNPLVIGDVDVDFESADITNNTTTEACIILTGASNKTHKFGVVTCREGIGILINTADARYDYNKLYAKMIRGYVNALAIVTTNWVCNFNEFHVMRLRSSQIPLRVYSASINTKWANECYFYLSAIEGYRDTSPMKLIEMTNATRCNFYNLDIEQPLANPDTDPAIELINCQTVCFFNPRTAEPFNAVQFRFIGECFNNYVDAEYCKYSTIDCSQMQQSDANYNIFRGAVITTNNGNTTNCNTLRIYKDMIVPVSLTKFTREVTEDLEINHNMILSAYVFSGGDATAFGVPTLYKWLGGNITVNKRFIALLPTTLQIMKTGDSVGNILDEDGNIIIDGSNMKMNQRYNINVDSYVYKLTDNKGEFNKQYKYLDNIVLSIDKVYSETDTSNLQTKHKTITVDLLQENWSSDSQTVTVDGVTSTNTVIVGAHPSYHEDYNDSGVKCLSQGENVLTFTCKETPTSNLQANVIIFD